MSRVRFFRGRRTQTSCRFHRRPLFMYITVVCPSMTPVGKSCAGNGIKSMMHSFMMSITSISLPWDTAIRERGNREIKSLPESVPEPGLCVSLTRWIISCISSSGQWPQRSCFPNEALRSSYFTISSCVESRLWCCRIHLHSMYAG